MLRRLSNFKKTAGLFTGMLILASVAAPIASASCIYYFGWTICIEK
jgi:hypothetical protein